MHFTESKTQERTQQAVSPLLAQRKEQSRPSAHIQDYSPQSQKEQGWQQLIQGSQGVSDNVVQRAIAVGQDSLNADQAFERLKAYNEQEVNKYKKEIRFGILPVYDRLNLPFPNVAALYQKIQPILAVYSQLFDVDQYGNFAQFIQAQRGAQQAVDKHDNAFQYLVTTVGFEHEFADMKDGPLRGVSHLEIARSQEALPYTGIHFIVETDAMNAVELVSPPFLFPTVKGAPIPDHEKVDRVDLLMKTTLATLLNELRPSYYADYITNYFSKSIEHLLASLSVKTGLNFTLLPKVVVKAEHLSHASNLKDLSKHLAPDKESPQDLLLNQESLEKIKIAESVKNKDEEFKVGSQVNFATTMEVANMMNEGNEDDDNASLVYLSIEKELRKRLIKPNGSPGLAAFYYEMISKFGSLFSVYFQQYVRQEQAALHTDLTALVQQDANHQKRGLTKKNAEKEFKMHASMSSYVKDVRPNWVKDHLESIAAGTLAPQDYPLLEHCLATAQLGNLPIPELLKELLIASGHTSLDQHWEQYLEELKNAKLSLQIAVGGFGMYLANNKPKVGLYEHNENYIGGRQDTYLNPKNVQQPGIWRQRLHVLEIRRGKPANKLKDAENRI